MWVHQEKAQRNVVLFYLPEDKQLGIGFFAQHKANRGTLLPLYGFPLTRPCCLCSDTKQHGAQGISYKQDAICFSLPAGVCSHDGHAVWPPLRQNKYPSSIRQPPPVQNLNFSVST